MFLLGLTGLLQMAVLPGWVWIRAAGIHTRNRCEEGLYCFAASLILNHWLVYLLKSIGQNNRAAWLIILAVEAVLLARLLRPWKGLRFAPVPVAEAPPEAPSAISLIVTALAVVTLLAFVPILVENWGTVFISNDDVASWDRWARDWFLNRAPFGAAFYPQLLPANWSITYALMQTDDVKMFAKAIMPLFAVGIPLLFVSMAWNRKDRVYLAGSSIAGFLLLQYLGRDFLMTGYADVALAFFCFLSFYVLYQEGSGPSGEARFLSLFFASGAALAKQGGLLVLVAIALYLVSAHLASARRRGNRRQPGASPVLRWSALLGITFVAVWFGPKFYSALTGNSNLSFVSTDVYQGRNYVERLLFGCRLIMDTGGHPGVFLFWVGVALTLGGLLFSKSRWLAMGIVLPAFVLWGFFFSYELRTGALLIPFVALVCCLTLQSIGTLALNGLSQRAFLRGPMAWLATALLLLGTGVLLYHSGEAVPQMRANYTWPLIFVGVCAALAPAVQVVRRLRVNVPTPAVAAGLALLFGLAAWPGYRDDRLLEQQKGAERLIGIAAVNDRLYRLHDAHELNQPILSNYWYLYSLPDLRSLNRVMSCGDCSESSLLTNIKQASDAGFVLVENSFLPAGTSRAIRHCPGLDRVFEEGSVRLFHIDRRRLGSTCYIDPETIRPVIQKLYPAETPAGHPFLVQPDGSAAIAVGCRNATKFSVVVWNGTELASSYGGPNALTAGVPDRLFAKPGHYPIEILDKDTELRSSPVYFDVK